MMSDPIQQQLIAARKNQILDAAAAVFAEKGFHPTTTKDIAKRAGIAEGTIYNYFESKTALLLGIFERMRASVIHENMPPLPDDLDLRTFIQAVMIPPLAALQQDNFALFRIVVSEMLVNEEMQRLFYEQVWKPTLAMAEAYFEKQGAQHGLAPDEARLVIRGISGMVLGLMLEYIMGDPDVIAGWDRLPALLADLMTNGLKGKPPP
jgi:TetR/AcrR family fatty acid metabolism transcriptional regulator